MKFNYQFPMRAVQKWETWSDGHQIAELAVAAEEAGFDMVSCTDHPYPDATWLREGGHQDFDLFVTLSFMAAKTERIRLLTYVLIAGYRNPYIAARAAASLDRMSDGRLTLGMGAGYLKEEFDVLGASFHDRGKRFDAAIHAMRNAWKSEVSDYDDPYFPSHNAIMAPPPVTPEGPPIWIGGNSKAALRRVAEFAHGWMPFQQTPEMAKMTGSPEMATYDDLFAAIESVKAMRVEKGNERPLDVCFGPLPMRTAEENIAHVAKNVEDFDRAGVTYISYSGVARSWNDAIEEIQQMGPVIRGQR
jgi:probable F420-dependent oxidoreductase